MPKNYLPIEPRKKIPHAAMMGDAYGGKQDRVHRAKFTEIQMGEQMGEQNTASTKKPRKTGPLGLNLAVKERFELSIQFLVYTLSRRAP